MATSEKPVVLVGIDQSEQSFYALTRTLDHFFTPFAPNYPFKLYLIHAIGCSNEFPVVEPDMKKIEEKVIQKAKDLCNSKSVHDVPVEIIEGDAREVLCDAVESHHATLLAVGSHDYKALKRAVLGSVSDYCAHHAHCSVMIVKKPKVKK